MREQAILLKAVLVASEHFTEAQLDLLRTLARKSKNAWKSLKKSSPNMLKNGFSLKNILKARSQASGTVSDGS